MAQSLPRCRFVLIFSHEMRKLTDVLQVLTIIDPIRAANEKRALIAAAVFCTLTPIFVETLLILRLLVVYPPKKISRIACLVIYAPPVALQIARIVNNAVTMHKVAQTYFNLPNVLAATEQSWQEHGTRVEFFLQVVDNAYVAADYYTSLHRCQR